MVHAQHTVVVDHPIAAVYAYLADGTNDAAWRPDVIMINHVSGSGVGAVYTQTMRGPGGRTIPGDFRITHLEEPVALSFEVIAGPARPTGSYTLREISSDSTQVTLTMDLKPKGFMVLMTPMIAKQVRAEVANLDNLATAMRS